MTGIFPTQQKYNIYYSRQDIYIMVIIYFKSQYQILVKLIHKSSRIDYQRPSFTLDIDYKLNKGCL